MEKAAAQRIATDALKRRISGTIDLTSVIKQRWGEHTPGALEGAEKKLVVRESVCCAAGAVVFSQLKKRLTRLRRLWLRLHDEA
jgi:hypothetical protein